MKKKKEACRIALILAAAVFIYRMREAWISIVIVLGMASVFALILTPVCVKIEHCGASRGISSLIAVIGLLMILFVLFISFVPYLITHAVTLAKQIAPTVYLVIQQGEQMLSAWGSSFLPNTSLPNMITTAMAPLTAGIAKGSVAVVSAAGKLVMALVISYYILNVRQEAGRHILMFIPSGSRRVFLSALKCGKNALLGYLSGMIKTSFFVGGTTLLFLMLLGIKEALILSLFMGLLESFPYIGPVLGSIPILLSVLPMGFGKTMMAVLFLAAIQQVESSIVGPYFTASSTSIHPLAAIIGVFVGGSVFGLWGVLLAVPLIIIARSVAWSIKSTQFYLIQNTD